MQPGPGRSRIFHGTAVQVQVRTSGEPSQVYWPCPTADTVRTSPSRVTDQSAPTSPCVTPPAHVSATLQRSVFVNATEPSSRMAWSEPRVPVPPTRNVSLSQGQRLSDRGPSMVAVQLHAQGSGRDVVGGVGGARPGCSGGPPGGVAGG